MHHVDRIDGRASPLHIVFPFQRLRQPLTHTTSKIRVWTPPWTSITIPDHPPRGMSELYVSFLLDRHSRIGRMALDRCVIGPGFTGVSPKKIDRALSSYVTVSDIQEIFAVGKLRMAWYNS